WSHSSRLQPLRRATPPPFARASACKDRIRAHPCGRIAVLQEDCRRLAVQGPARRCENLRQGPKTRESRTNVVWLSVKALARRESEDRHTRDDLSGPHALAVDKAEKDHIDRRGL